MKLLCSSSGPSKFLYRSNNAREVQCLKASMVEKNSLDLRPPQSNRNFVVEALCVPHKVYLTLVTFIIGHNEIDDSCRVFNNKKKFGENKQFGTFINV